ncbi:MAG: sensor histidine kinase, partial [Natronomonas sp.]
VMTQSHIERGEDLIRTLLSTDEDRGTFEMDILTADGRRIPCENHVALLPFEDEFRGTVGTIRDISDRVERERRLQKERDRLDEFAGVISHDLRNPLNVAQGRLGLSMTECDSEHLETADRALDRIDELIDGLLALAREGDEVRTPEPVDLRDLVRNCWRNVETAEATLAVEFDDRIRADPSRLQQLLENLIRNAVQHGGDDVTILVGELDEGFYLEDDGPGIPDAATDDVFEVGYSTSEVDTGFGLSIVKQIVDAHGWTIRVTEGADGGARFEITGVEIDAS